MAASPGSALESNAAATVFGAEGAPTVAAMKTAADDALLLPAPAPFKASTAKV